MKKRPFEHIVTPSPRSECCQSFYNQKNERRRMKRKKWKRKKIVLGHGKKKNPRKYLLFFSRLPVIAKFHRTKSECPFTVAPLFTLFFFLEQPSLFREKNDSFSFNFFFFSLFSIKAMYKNRRPKPHKSRREFRKNHSDKAIFDRRGGGIEKRHFFYSIFTQSLIAFLVNRYCK